MHNIKTKAQLIFFFFSLYILYGITHTLIIFTTLQKQQNKRFFLFCPTFDLLTTKKINKKDRKKPNQTQHHIKQRTKIVDLFMEIHKNPYKEGNRIRQNRQKKALAIHRKAFFYLYCRKMFIFLAFIYLEVPFFFLPLFTSFFLVIFQLVFFLSYLKCRICFCVQYEPQKFNKLAFNHQ